MKIEIVPRWVSRLLALLLLLWSTPALANDFKTHYDLGLALYQAHKFEQALPEFQAAYEINPRPGLLFNIAQCYRKAGKPKEAIAYYDRYLASDPQVDGETRRKVDGYLAEARNTLAALELELKQRLSEEKAQRERDAEPPPGPAPAPPPAVSPAPQPAPQLLAPAPQPPPAKPPLYKRWWLWTAVGAAVVVGAAVGVTVGVVTAPKAPTVDADVPRAAISF